MVSTEGLSPADPARWWLAYMTERELAEEEAQQDQRGQQDIQVVDNDATTL